MKAKEIREYFWELHPEFKHERRSRKRQNDYRTDIRVAWCDYLDMLSRNGQITEKRMAQGIAM
tara:strand:- start:3646 stop:3834 length:189 start_codon:yes stop_codon:yes gene_type:complete